VIKDDEDFVRDTSEVLEKFMEIEEFKNNSIMPMKK